MKNKLLYLATAIILTASCGTKEVQRTCRCCGGFSGGCWDESVVSGKTEAEAREKCISRGGNGADFNCDVD